MKTAGGRRLSSFQRMMREWKALAPYNFVHAMRLVEPLDIGRWRNAMTSPLKSIGLSAAEIPVEEVNRDLETHLAAELQRPVLEKNPPLRFFCVNARWLGVVFDHWVADDFSSRALLHRIYAGYGRGGANDSLASLRWTPLPRASTAWQNWTAFFKQAAIMRRATRIHLNDPMDFQVGTFRRTFPNGALRACRELAKQRGATVNDVLLAAIAQALATVGKFESSAERDAIALVTAADLRRFAHQSDADGFGMHVGHFTVVAERPNDIPLPELVGRIAKQTRQMKDAPIDITGPALLLWKLSRSRRAKCTFFQRSAPIAAGLSNVNLTGSWIEQSDIAEYRRVGPTGPAIPILLAITTLRGQVSVDVTFRTTGYTAAEASAVIQDMMRRLPANIPRMTVS